MNGIQPNVACKHLNSDKGDTLERNTDKAELLARKFAKVSSTANYSEKFRKRKDELKSDCNLLNNDVETDERNIHLNTPFSQHELARALRQAKQNTSPGEDGIPYECLIVQELRAIYLLEMTKCLTGIFGKGLPWDIQNRTS